MAGEWIAYDLGLPDKPEVQELIDETGLPVEAVVFALLRLWGWAAMNCADGRARMTVPRLVRTCGQDESFWRAVAAVGWLEIDETDATVAIPGWDRRFSQAAKSRLQNADRATAYEDRRRRAGGSRAQARDVPAPTRGRGEEIRGEDPPPPRESFAAFVQRWNAGPGRPWTPASPPDGWTERAAEPGWLEDALAAIERLPRCRFFRSPVTLPQFLGAKFVRLCLGGQYDEPKAPKGGADAPSGAESAEAAAARWRAGVEQSRARNAEYLASKARRTTP
jgi:hypothetical protein